MDTPETFEDVFEPIYRQAFDLLVKKQRAYGSGNVAELGFFGVYSRLASDKIQRLRNLMHGRIEKGQAIIEWADDPTGDESVEDTLLDIVNYAAILLALKRGQWGKPLRGTEGTLDARRIAEGGVVLRTVFEPFSDLDMCVHCGARYLQHEHNPARGLVCPR